MRRRLMIWELTRDTVFQFMDNGGSLLGAALTFLLSAAPGCSSLHKPSVVSCTKLFSLCEAHLSANFDGALMSPSTLRQPGEPHARLQTACVTP